MTQQGLQVILQLCAGLITVVIIGHLLRTQPINPTFHPVGQGTSGQQCRSIEN